MNYVSYTAPYKKNRCVTLGGKLVATFGIDAGGARAFAAFLAGLEPGSRVWDMDLGERIGTGFPLPIARATVSVGLHTQQLGRNVRYRRAWWQFWKPKRPAVRATMRPGK